jgi:hydroxyacylglutathione hydrolase
MKAINSQGPPLLNGLPGGEVLTAHEFRRQRESSDSVVIDLRRPEAFGGAHIPRAFNIGAGQNLSLWAGWVIPPDRPILLVGDASVNLGDARRSLIRVGLDDIRGSLRGGMSAWIEAGLEQAHLPQTDVRDLAAKLERDGEPFVLDVRSPDEWKNGHIRGACISPGAACRSV